MKRRILLKGGPSDGETITIDAELNIIRVAKTAHNPEPVIIYNNKTYTGSIGLEAKLYKQSEANSSIFEYQSE